MATQKTLTPTNQTITIDAYQDEKPDYRHVADAEGKLADAVNALNSQLTGAITWLNGTSQELSNCSAYNDVGLVTWQRGKLVIVAMNVSGLTANSRTKIATLPSGLRPLMDATFFGGAGLSYSNKAIMTFRANGEVYVLSDDNYASGYFLFYAA